MQIGKRFCVSMVTFTVVGCFSMVVLIPQVSAGTHSPAAEQTVFSFDGTHGSYPSASVIVDKAGNIYGTTYQGGTAACGISPQGCGVVYELSRNSNGEIQETVLHSFGGGADGGAPAGGLVMDSAGNLYGTTVYGGSGACAAGCGTVFELSPTAGGWTETVVHSFNGADGRSPECTLLLGPGGELFGTASQGGASGLAGVAFELIPSGGSWQETVLYNFMGGADGANPESGLVADASGNLYGTTLGGGIDVGPCSNGTGCGTVFEISKTGGSWSKKIIYEFTGTDGDGGSPYAPLVFDPEGNLYGTTEHGKPVHSKQPEPLEGGTVFELSPAGNSWTKKGLASCEICQPSSPVVLDPSGRLYGTGSFGRNANRGIVFALSPSNGQWIKTILYSFTGGADGGTPEAGLTPDGAGNYYGTTADGGSSVGVCGQESGCGTVFAIQP